MTRRNSPAPDGCTDEAFAAYRPWFYAAALYNLAWGAVNVLFPSALFDLLDIDQPNYGPLWQVVGMFVLVYAPAYYWAGRRPATHRHIVAIGLLGKLLGPLGFAWSVANDDIPAAFGWTILTNDLIWWPAFGLYFRDVIRRCGGWSALIRGD
jgi:small multidrug resistance pump